MRGLAIGFVLAATVIGASLFISTPKQEMREAAAALRSEAREIIVIGRPTGDFVGETGGDDVRIERFFKEALRKFQLEQETPRLMWRQ